MDLDQFNLDPLVSLANKVAPSFNYVNGMVLIAVVSMELDTSIKLGRMLEARVDPRYCFESFDYRMANEVKLVRGRTRALVIMTDRIALGTEAITSFRNSLMTVSIVCCSYVGEPDFKPIANDFIVDMDANTFYKNKSRK